MAGGGGKDFDSPGLGGGLPAVAGAGVGGGGGMRGEHRERKSSRGSKVTSGRAALDEDRIADRIVVDRVDRIDRTDRERDRGAHLANANLSAMAAQQINSPGVPHLITPPQQQQQAQSQHPHQQHRIPSEQHRRNHRSHRSRERERDIGSGHMSDRGERDRDRGGDRGVIPDHHRGGERGLDHRGIDREGIDQHPSEWNRGDRDKTRDSQNTAPSQSLQRRGQSKGGTPPDVVNSVVPLDKPRKTRNFVFESSKERIRVKILELIDANYGLYVWPCAPVLAQYIWFYRDHVKNKRVLELGAGTGLPGILAALLGARVTLSDSANYPLNIRHCQQNVEENGLSTTEVPVLGVTWGAFSPSLFELGPVDLILGSDILYDTKDFENVIVTASYLLHQNQHARFWSTYQIRNPEYNLEKLLKKWNLVCMRVPLDHFDADTPSIGGSSLPGVQNIEMLVMTVDPTQEEPKQPKKDAIRC
ncbi:uncharacterized protein LOC111243645 isoform X2 [Varroa destructor]|uniref:Methyltransferase-like protein 23 n=1 Tax=Varroa destructor TaxID=109461 RepID=A0A7M7J0N3_VARDE|nr:uncharacterized protein LOC111243645 isoform X2 [Varroa destructor]